jgi:hypothetical protein
VEFHGVPGRQVWSAVAADAVCVLAFCAVGRRSHAEGVTVSGVAETAWPFLVGAAVGWLVSLGVHHRRRNGVAQAQLRRRRSHFRNRRFDGDCGAAAGLAGGRGSGSSIFGAPSVDTVKVARKPPSGPSESSMPPS